MRLSALLLLLAFPAFGQNQIPAAPPEQIVDIPPTNCGLVTRYASHSIPDGCLQSARNVIFDNDIGIQRRSGFAACNTSSIGAFPIRRLYEFNATDGTRYIVAISSDKVYKAGTDCAFSAIAGLAGLDSSQNTACVAALGKIWCVNQTDGLKWWDGTSTGTVPSAPKGNLIDRFRNRILISYVNGSQSSLYGSGDVDGTDWYLGARSTSAFQIPIGGTNDGLRIRCLMGTYNDSYVIGKENALYGFYGFDNNDFVVRELSREVGCIDNQTVQEHEDAILWLSKRGVERMKGTVIDWKISDPIYDILQPIVAATQNTQSITDTSQSDFEQGNLIASSTGAPLSATINPGNVVPSTWTAVDTSSSNFAGGTFVNTSTLSLVGAVLFNPSSASFTNAGAELGTAFTPYPGWASTAWTPEATASMYGSFAWALGNTVCAPTTGNTYTITILSPDDVPLYAQAAAETDGMDTLLNFDISSQPYVTVKLKVFQNGGVGSTQISQPFMRPNKLSVRLRDLSAFVGTCRVAFDLDEATQVTSGTFTSRIFDTRFSTPTFGPFEATMSSDTYGAITLKVQASTASDGGGFETLVAQTNSNKITAAQRRYLRYQLGFSVVSGTNTAYYYQTDLQAATSGYFISSCKSLTGISAWGLFGCDTQTSGSASFSFWVATATHCNGVTNSTATWNAQVNNTVVAVATAAFAAYRVLELPTNGTDTVRLEDCTFNWTAGAARPEAASIVYDHKYHLFYTSSTAAGSVNSNALVLDSRDRWALWDGIPARSATLFNRLPLYGDGNSTGLVYDGYTGYSDNGASFTSSFRTKDYDLGNWRTKKQLSQLYVETSSLRDSGDTTTISFTGYVDIAYGFSLSSIFLGEAAGVLAARLPFPLDSQASGRYISIEGSNTGAQHWKFYRGSIRYRPLQEE